MPSAAMPVQVGRGDVGGAEAAEVLVALVVGEDDDDIGRLSIAIGSLSRRDSASKGAAIRNHAAEDSTFNRHLVRSFLFSLFRSAGPMWSPGRSFPATWR